MKSYFKSLFHYLRLFHYWNRGHSFQPKEALKRIHFEESKVDNPLKTFFDAKHSGRGIWKWTHYFDVYHRHLSTHRSKPVQMLEIGIYSGGSLDMWYSYFGSESTIHGVDIEPACAKYANAYTHIHIGDQADHAFWQRFKKEVPLLDVIVDDGGHQAYQQEATFEALFDHLAPGGVYICEDIHGRFQAFGYYLMGLATGLHAMLPSSLPLSNPSTALQSQIASVHVYPYIVVIEKLATPRKAFYSEKHGEEWNPFYDTQHQLIRQPD